MTPWWHRKKEGFVYDSNDSEIPDLLSFCPAFRETTLSVLIILEMFVFCSHLQGSIKTAIKGIQSRRLKTCVLWELPLQIQLGKFQVLRQIERIILLLRIRSVQHGICFPNCQLPSLLFSFLSPLPSFFFPFSSFFHCLWIFFVQNSAINSLLSPVFYVPNSPPPSFLRGHPQQKFLTFNQRPKWFRLFFFFSPIPTTPCDFHYMYKCFKISCLTEESEQQKAARCSPM